MDSFDQAWEIICEYCRSQITDVAYKTWFGRLRPVSIDFEKGKAIIEAPNDFHKQTLLRCYSDLLNQALQNVFGNNIGFEIHVADDPDPALEKDDSQDDGYELTFDTFVVGPSNQLACSAARAVADAPGRRYNPLFIYGSSGLGKTHLLYAIAHEIRRQSPSARILYIKGDEFINDFIETVRSGRSMNDFRVKYREADLMLVDDIQFVAGKVETQNEFFHTFNTLYESKKQIVLTSDRPPQEMALLDDRLRTRFEWGLMADVQQPVLETRVAIVKNKAANLGLILDDSIANYIADKITSNVRQLEGTVHKIKAFHDLNIPIDQTAVDRAIQDMIRSNEFTITPENIIKEVCRYFRLEEDQIRGPSRSRDILNARQIAMYLIRRMTNLSLDETGKLFGGRDHSTTLNGVTKVENRMKNDNTFAETVKAIITNVNTTK